MDCTEFKCIQREFNKFINKSNILFSKDNFTCFLSYENEMTYTFKYSLDGILIHINFIFEIITDEFGYDLQYKLVFDNNANNYYIHKIIINLLNIENHNIFEYNNLDFLLHGSDLDFMIAINSESDLFYKNLKALNAYISNRDKKCSICLKTSPYLMAIDNDFDPKYKICNKDTCIETYHSSFINENYLNKLNTSNLELINIMFTNVFISPRYFKLITIPAFIDQTSLPFLITQIKDGVHLNFTKSNNFEYFKSSILLYKLYLYFIYKINNYNFYEQENDIKLNNCKVFKVHNSDYDYTKFKEEENDYLFHGSIISNWYSILSNGLKAGSTTAGTLLNGSAYGSGIYLSNSPFYSINYSTGCRTNVSYETNNSGKYIMGVYQVLKPYQTYKKATNIYVIPNPEEVILKYLFIIDNTTNRDKIIKYIQEKYNNETIKSEECSTLNLISKMQNGRLKKELNDIMKNDSSKTDLYISIHLNNPLNINIWDINYSIENIPFDNILYTQLLDKHIKDIKLQILIPKRYPFEPPFVRVVYPRFKFRTGHITLGGSICMEVLSNKGWMPAMNIHNLLLQIKLLIITGSAELDDTNWNNEYTLVEAKTAFNRMISSHGW